MVFDFDVRQWGSLRDGGFLLTAELVGRYTETVSTLLWELFIYRVRRRPTPEGPYAAFPYINNRPATNATRKARLRDKTRLARLGAFSRLGLSGRIAHCVLTRGKCVRSEICVEAISYDPQRFLPGAMFK